MEGVLKAEELINETAIPTLEECISKLTQLFRVHVHKQNIGTKSELCASWLEGNFCAFFPNCHFAHGWADVKPRVYDKKMFKVKPCLSENCSYTTRCQFFHDDVVYTLTPELRVFYSKREKMHRVSLASHYGKLLVLSLREPENPERCPYYVELMPFLTAVYRVLPSTSCAFLHKINKQSNGFSSRQQSKIKVPSYGQLSHGHHIHHQSHRMPQHPFIQLSMNPYQAQYYPQFGHHNLESSLSKNTLLASIFGDSAVAVGKRITQPLETEFPTTSMYDSRSHMAQHHQNATTDHISMDTVTPLTTPVSQNHIPLAIYPMAQIKDKQGETYSSMKDVMQQLNALSLCPGITDEILKYKQTQYINENFNELLSQQPHKIDSTTPSRPQCVVRNSCAQMKQHPMGDITNQITTY